MTPERFKELTEYADADLPVPANKTEIVDLIETIYAREASLREMHTHLGLMCERVKELEGLLSAEKTRTAAALYDINAALASWHQQAKTLTSARNALAGEVAEASDPTSEPVPGTTTT